MPRRLHPLVMLLAPVLLVAMALSFLPTGRSEALACEATGHCSMGQVQPWSGDIITGDGMRAVLSARAYNKEVIVSSTAAHLIELSLHLHAELTRLGFAHHVFTTHGKTDCDTTMWYLPDWGCAWDSTPQHPGAFEYEHQSWYWRWKFVARTARMGYNVMELDLDVMLFSNPYVHLKAPHFDSVTLFGNPEYHCNLNGGFLYIQNAKPNGPATWALKEVIERPLRFLDDDMEALRTWSTSLVATSSRPRICMSYDQSWLDDCVKSTFIGAPYYQRFIEDCMNDTLLSRPAVDAMVNQDNRVHCTALSEDHTLGTDKRQLPHHPHRNAWHYGTMKVPNVTEAQWHGRWLNRSLLPAVRGNWSAFLWRQLREDCPDCPPWRDEERDGEDKGKAKEEEEEIEEMFGFVPQWLFGSFQTHGWDGYWSPSPSGEPPLQVMGHVHWIVGSPRDLGNKLGLPMMYHTPNFTSLAAVRRSQSPYLTKAPVERVLTLPPHLDLGALLVDIHDLHRALAGLLQLATLSNRTVAWPVLPCNASWMASPLNPAAGVQPQVPLNLREGLLPFVDPDDPERGYVCFAACMFAEACSEKSALLPPEYRHWKQVSGRDVPPGAGNTVLLPSAGLAAVVSQRGQDGNASRIAVMSDADASRALKAVDDQAVVYVGYPVLVEGMEHKSDAFKERAWGCQGLHPHWFYHSHMMDFVLVDMPRVKLDKDRKTLLLSKG